MADIDTEFAAQLAAKDPKTAVNQFCQRYCARPVTKDDIAYICEKYPGGFQATCKLNCIEGQEFAGELLPTQKEAEKSASQQVLAFYAEQIANMPKAASKNKKKRPAAEVTTFEGVPAGALAPGTAGLPVANAAVTAKSELNSTCMKIMRRVMAKGEIVYETAQVVGGFQATVQVPNLPNEWGQQVWAGEVTEKKQEAEQSAAQIALDAIKQDPVMMASLNAPAKPKNNSWAGGKGGKKGKMMPMQPGGINKGGKGGHLQVGAAMANQLNAQMAFAGMGFGF
jgi:dsRNA-specific ribonuclease